MPKEFIFSYYVHKTVLITELGNETPELNCVKFVPDI